MPSVAQQGRVGMVIVSKLVWKIYSWCCDKLADPIFQCIRTRKKREKRKIKKKKIQLQALLKVNHFFLNHRILVPGKDHWMVFPYVYKRTLKNWNWLTIESIHWVRVIEVIFHASSPSHRMWLNTPAAL